MRIAASVAALLVPITLASGESAPAARSLCKMGEPVLFECAAGTKRIAVCGKSPEYRFGTPAKLDLRVGTGSYAATAYSGGGEAQLIVTNGGYRYIIYSSVIRTSFGPDGNKPEFEAGVSVQRGGSTVSSRACSAPEDAAVDLALAQTLLPKSTFVDR